MRAAFNAWGRNCGEDPWDATVWRDTYVVIDGPALESLVNDGQPEGGRAVVVDARGRRGEAEGPDHLGWMRCKAAALT
ncbi:hypothetical protein DL766_006908 [Monosporascus sp. MC13-8B]|uniref:Rhodanese domain-containing protein n=1 Tax=Monosporascus cannonballus TaxID=155416 RepID=A0ABY0HH27_9PEZI|nr:hypothetical protein DL762_002759 [Monosporascus cannonballus]RYO99642.1 hypothetical protein DL763_001356 [Monosporascus cannonballus]RYP25815.1 hypothetical protein DL766_006908 [Monosporascus sp. MC13-8B]